MNTPYFADIFFHNRKDGVKANVRVTYSALADEWTKSFRKMAPYRKVWRIGANKAIEMKFYYDVELGKRE